MTVRYRVKNVGTVPVEIDPWGDRPFYLDPGDRITSEFRSSNIDEMKANPNLKLTKVKEPKEKSEDSGKSLYTPPPLMPPV